MSNEDPQQLHLAFYTCFFGSDTNGAFAIPPVPSSIYNCYYYTNNTKLYTMLNDTKWIRIFVDEPVSEDLIESAFSSKKLKAAPHTYSELQNYDYTCYFDSKQYVDDYVIVNHIKTLILNTDVAVLLVKHPFIQTNVWEEFHVSMRYSRYNIHEQNYREYITKCRLSGLSILTPIHYCTGFIVRNMKHPKIQELNDTWYSHIQECGIQCQISFFFVKQLFDGHVKELPSINSSNYIMY
jgi:hypothetical protein